MSFGTDGWRLGMDDFGKSQASRIDRRPRQRLRGKAVPARRSESVGRNAQRGVMIKAAPAASLVVSKAQFLFQFLVIALDPPAQFGQINQAIEGHVRREGGQPIVASQYLAGS